MKFFHPQFFIILLFIPVYFWLIWRSRKRHEAVQVSVFEDLKKSNRRNFAAIVPYINHCLIVLLLLFFAVTLARPQSLHQKEELSKDGIDIIIALDVSESMLAEDLQPNRIEAAKEQIKSFVSNLTTDRLGIIVFAGQAFTQSPLTFDYDILTQYLNDISTNSIDQGVRGLNGTAIGDAILAAVNRFKKSEDRSKVLVLLTDGDANTGVDPLIAAEMAKKDNIKIYTIGIGSDGGAPIPVKDALGRKQYAQNPDGTLYKTAFNEDKLKQIAKMGGGLYFRVDQTKSFKDVFDSINKLEKRPIKVNTLTDATDNFYPFLLVLFLIFLAYLSLNGVKIIKK
jgi:Ca-activated chloride channel family protein